MNARVKRIKQIRAYIQLHPQLAEVIPYNFESFEEKDLDDLYFACRVRASEGTEYTTVSAVVFSLLAGTEKFARVLLAFPALSENAYVKAIASLDSGTISSYLQFGIVSGDPNSIETELREIAIDFIGWMPQSPYVRLGIKLSMKVYDFISMEQNPHLQRADANLKARSNIPMSDELMARVRRSQQQDDGF